MSVARHVVVHGVVQGVSFRWSCAERARAAGVVGWVRNLPDGTVEALLEGPAEAVEEVVAWCRQGPPSAVVEQVAVDEASPQGATSFEVR